MARSVYQQTDFRGGAWMPASQGRSDLPLYHAALNLCINQIPTEEGAVTRRGGTQTLGPTHGRTAAELIRFESESAHPYTLEFTALALRLWYDQGLVGTDDHQVITASSSTAGTISLTTTTSHGWAAGDELILVTSTALAAADLMIVRNRIFKIATQNGTTGLTMKDDLGNALPDDISSGGLNGATAIRVLRFTTTYTIPDLTGLRMVQAETQGFVLSKTSAPQVLTVTTDIAQTTANSPVMAWAAATFTDGPYLDPQGTVAVPETATVSGYTGSITLTPLTTTFDANDVGRLIRLFSRPADWASGTTYNYGDTVTYNGEYWSSINQAGSGYTNLGQTPGSASVQTTGVAVNFWAPSPQEGQWAWGTITAQAGTSCTVSLSTDLNSKNGTAIAMWQLGLYKAGQYPTCGLFYKGRLFLAGAVSNRVDGSMANGVIPGAVSFSPTDIYGTVNDDHAMALIANSENLNTFYWLRADHQGILIGTSGPEFLIHTSTLNDPLTPFTVDIDTVSNYQSAPIEPIRPGMALVFVQRYRQRVLEFLADAFSGKYSGRHLNEYSKHLTEKGIVKLAYQEEKVPIVWALVNPGSLTGWSYRRISRFVTEPPAMAGAHESRITFEDLTASSICTTPAIDGLADRLYICIEDTSGQYWMEMMHPVSVSA